MLDARMVLRRCRSLQGMGTWALLVGCGGQSVLIDEAERDGRSFASGPTSEEPAPAPTNVPAPTPTNVPAPTPTAAPVPMPPSLPEPVPVAPPSCAELGLHADLEWTAQGPNYGLVGPGMLSFSPDGARLATTGHAYDSATLELDVATGTGRREQTTDEVIYGRDAGWRFELRAQGSVLRAIDLSSGADGFYRDLVQPAYGAALSDDGRFVGVLACRNGTLVAFRWELEGGEVREVSLTGCEPYVGEFPFTLVEHGRAALLAPSTSGGVTRVDFEHGTFVEAIFHEQTYTSQSVFGIALSPDGSMGVSAGLHEIRAFAHPGLEPLFEPIEVAVATSFSNCYVGHRYLSGLAFSPDGRFVATPGAGQRLTLRRTCDFAPVFEIESAPEPYCSDQDETPPGLASFSPLGDRLAVWWGGAIGMFRLRE